MQTIEWEPYEFPVSQWPPDKNVLVRIKVLRCMIMYMSIYSPIFVIKSEISPMKTSAWDHVVLSKKSQKRAVEIHKLKENRCSFPLSCLLCLLLEIIFFFCHIRCMGCLFLCHPNEALKSIICLNLLPDCYPMMIAIRMLLACICERWLRVRWDSKRKKNRFLALKWTADSNITDSFSSCPRSS